MSIKIMSRVWEFGPEKQADRFVLLAIADYANDDGECWPSITGICRKTCMSERGVQTIIRRLEAQGWLDIETGKGRRNCNLYTVKNPALHAPRTTCTPHMDAQTPHMDVKNPAPHAPEPSYNHQEPSELYIPDQLSLVAPVSKPPDLFSEFWDRYPRKASKAEAHKAYARAMKKIAHDDLMFALSERLPALEMKEQKFIPHASTWLNQERWNDELDADSNTNGSRPGGSGNAMVDAFAAVAAERTARNGGN